MIMRKFAVSMVSQFPWSFNGDMAVKMALCAGFDGIQALPLRGLNLKSHQNWMRYVVSWEDAWNFGPAWSVPMRHAGRMPNAPTLKDWVLFQQPEFPSHLVSGIHCMHNWQPGANVAMEIHPELSTNLEEYLSKVAQGYGLVIDIRHMRRPCGNGDAGIKNWRRWFDVLPRGSIKLIHIQPVGEEIGQLLARKGEISEMVWKLGIITGPNVPIVLEVIPKIQSPQATIDRLASLLQAIKRLM